MSLPPAWKIKRELLRTWGQASRAVVGTLYDPARRVIHDQLFGRRVAVRDGQLPPTGRIAIFSIFQPAGVAPSTFFTLEHMASTGHALIVVSNAPLQEGDTAALLDRCTLLATRPNAGYDFGGYRDGLRLMARLGLRPDRLVLMNDSTWFPLRETDDTLDRMAALDCDMSGHVFKTESADHRGRDHVESHLLMFSARALRSTAFQDFWDGYLMSNTRELTIRRGEKGITQAMQTADMKLGALLGQAKFMEIIGALSEEDLRRVLGDIVHHREDARSLCEGLQIKAAAGKPWRATFLDWVDRSLQNSRQHLLSATFIAPAMRHGGLGFVKKAKDLRFHLAREKVLQMETEGHIAPMHVEVRREMKLSVSRFSEEIARKAPGAFLT